MAHETYSTRLLIFTQIISNEMGPLESKLRQSTRATEDEMRGADILQEALFTTKQLEDFVPMGHPIRAISAILNQSLKAQDALFATMYSRFGRDSIAPEKLLRATMLQALYGIRSERALCEQLEYNMLFRWFVGVGVEQALWDHSTFTRNRQRFIAHDAARAVFAGILTQAEAAGLLSEEHFSVDGSLIRAWASNKSLVPRDPCAPPPERSGPANNVEVNFKGQRRSNDTHVSATDPEAMLCTKSPREAAHPSYLGHVLMENRSGLAVDCTLTHANMAAEREAALEMVGEQPKARTLGADKNYDTRSFVAACRNLGVTPHVAQNSARAGGSAIDGRTTRHVGYEISQRIRKRIETIFGDAKQHRNARQFKVRGKAKADFMFTLTIAVSNLVRMAGLMRGSAMAATG